MAVQIFSTLVLPYELLLFTTNGSAKRFEVNFTLADVRNSNKSADLEALATLPRQPTKGAPWELVQSAKAQRPLSILPNESEFDVTLNTRNLKTII